MKFHIKHNTKRLSPAQPPKRLELNEVTGRDTYRRQSSLLYTIFHHPRRLHRPRRLLAAKVRRELGYRLTACVLSLALLLSMVSDWNMFFPRHAVAADSNASQVLPDYRWLTDGILAGQGGSEDNPFIINSAQQLHSLSQLVLALQTTSSTLSITVDTNSYTVRVGTLDSNIIAISTEEGSLLDTPMETAPPEVPPATTTPPAPQPTPGATPTATPQPTPEPTPTATVAPVPTAVPEPTPVPLPTPLPEELTPKIPAISEDSPMASILPPAPGAGLSSSIVAAREFVVSDDIVDEFPVLPGEGDLPVTLPDNPIAPPANTPTNTPDTTPAPTNTPDATPAPTNTPDATPAPTNTPDATLTPTNTPAPENGVGDLMATLSSELYLPIGLANCYFKIGKTFSLGSFSGNTVSGAGDSAPWIPIGQLTSASGALAGLPFLGHLDGDNHLLSKFYFSVPSSGAVGVGFGLFGYVGATGSVKNVSLDLALTNSAGALSSWVMETYDTVGPLVAGSGGSIDGCTVSNGTLTIKDGAASPRTVGGVVGRQVGGMVTNSATTNYNFSLLPTVTAAGGVVGRGQGTTISGNLFTGTITQANATATKITNVGGILGLAETTAVSVLNCGVAATLSLMGDAGSSLGGIVGSTRTALTVDGCFSTGKLSSNYQVGGLLGFAQGASTLKNSFSSAAISSMTQAAMLLNGEHIGGLVGSLTNKNSIFENLYYAGSLLEPQLPSIMGESSVVPTTWSNVVAEFTVAPNSPFKVLSNTASLTVGLAASTMPAANWTSAVGFLPQLTWAATSTNPLAKAISETAAKVWIPLDTSNAVAGETEAGVANGFNLYRMKTVDGTADGNIPLKLKELTLTTPLLNAAGTRVGGIYETTVTLGGYAVPIQQQATLAPSQTAPANRIVDAVSLHRFLDVVNIGGAGYLGGAYRIESVAAAGAVANYTNGRAFCGVLAGTTDQASNTITDLTFPTANSVGLFQLTYLATLKNFTLNHILVGAADKTVAMNINGFGIVSAQSGNTVMENITIASPNYQYNHTSGDYGLTGGTPVGFLVGATASSTLSVNNVTVTEGVCKITTTMDGRTNRLLFGGLLGAGDRGDSAFTNCNVELTAHINVSGSALHYDTAAAVGGIIGYDNVATQTITNCHVVGDLVGSNTGGLMARSKHFTFRESSFTGTIATSSGISYSSTVVNCGNSGGLVAYPQHESGSGNIIGCAVLGNITGVNYVGGFTGYSSTPTTITSSYAQANVASTFSTAGGLMGYYTTKNIKPITNSYFSGQVLGVRGTGGLLGQFSDISKAPAAGYFATAIYDDTMQPFGIATVGGYNDIYKSGVKPDDARWNALGSAYSYNDLTHHYPQLNTLQATNPTLSDYSTLKMFRLGTSTNLYQVRLSDVSGGTFQTVLPAPLAVTPRADAPLMKNITTPVDAFDVNTYQLNPASSKMTGIFDFTYPGMWIQGSTLSIPYEVGIKPFEHGTGTVSDPFIIPDPQTMDTFRQYTDLGLSTQNTYFIVAGTDKNILGQYTYPAVTIDLSTYAPTKLWPGMTGTFSGHFDGNDSTIATLVTNGAVGENNTWAGGLFYNLGLTADIHDLTIADAVITGPTTANAISGGGVLSAFSRGGSVRNVSVSGSISAGRGYSVGGLIGRLSSTGDAVLKQVVTDVVITGGGTFNTAYGDTRGPTIWQSGAGGILGFVEANTSVTAATLTMEECAAYGIIDLWPVTGGLIGHMLQSKLTTTVTNSLSLTQMNDVSAGTGTFVQGGLIGSSIQVALGRLNVTNSYFAGESNVASSDSRLTGGFVGVSSANNDGTEQFSTLNALHIVYDKGIHRHLGATLLTKSGAIWNKESVWNWPENGSDGTDGFQVTPEGSAFEMTQEADSSSLQYQMIYWDPSIWSFEDGLFPRLKFQGIPTEDPDTIYHVAVVYTKGGGVQSSTNAYVRYHGATLTLTDPTVSAAFLKETFNQLMVVATDTDSDTHDLTLGVKIGTTNYTRPKIIIPTTSATGFRDMSIYTINPNGMWAEDDRTWTIYNADAFAGLSGVFSTATKDANGVPRPADTTRPGAKPNDLLELGREVSLSHYATTAETNDMWPAIGTDDVPFDTTFNGNGHRITDLTMKEAVSYQDYIAGTGYVTGYYPRAGQMGLFGTVDGGTIQNIILITGETDPTADTINSIHTTPLITAVGSIAATVKNGTLENCFADIPIYGGTVSGIPVGGLVGQVTGTATLTNCAYTGYVFTDATAETFGRDNNSGQWLPVRYGANLADLPPAAGGTTGGLVGHVTAGSTLNLTSSYSAGYVQGDVTGALIGANNGTVAATNLAYDRNASGDSIPAVGSGIPLEEAQVSSTIPMDGPGEGWQGESDQSRYPLQTALTANDPVSSRVKLFLTPHSRSTVSGNLTAQNATVSNSTFSPIFATGAVTVTDGTAFTKTTDGLTQLLVTTGDKMVRRVLINLRCWYDDMTLVTVDGVTTRHYSIGSAAELWELSELVNGTLGTPASKVDHTHDFKHATPTATGGYDDFSNAVITLSANCDLALLTDGGEGATVQRPWVPIGVQHPFAGVFEGAGNAVTHMTLHTSGGLFGTVSGTVQNLLLSESTLTLPAGTTGGLLVGTVTATGEVLHCGTSGAVVAGSTSVAGGLAGENQGAINGCYSTAALTQAADAGLTFLGGIAGENNGGSIVHSYFAGYCDSVSAGTTAGTVGGIAALSLNSSTTDDCYITAYLAGNTVYTAASGALHCVFDGRYTTSFDNSATRQDGNALTMDGGSWQSDPTGLYYPRLNYFINTPTLQGTPLQQSADIAAALFTFSGYTGAGYARFSTVRVPAVSDMSSLHSSDLRRLTVSGSEAHTLSENSGNVVLSLRLAGGSDALFSNPCYLNIPTALAFTYQFNWEALLTQPGVVANPDYNTGTSTTNTWSNSGTLRTISSRQDFINFVSYANANSLLGITIKLNYDLDFAGGQLPQITRPFDGTFHGGSHTISNFTATGPLFTEVMAGAQVTMVAFTNGRVTTAGVGGNATLRVALVAGINRGRISNIAAESCYVSASNSSITAPVMLGGLVAENIGMLDCSYFFTTQSYQVHVALPVGGGAALDMGGLVGLNTGTVNGCYFTGTLECNVGGSTDGTYIYLSTLVGMNNGGRISFSYWDSNQAVGGEILVTAYKEPGGSVPGRDLFFKTTDLKLVARWLSADCYGGSYYLDASNNLRLYSYRLAKYDLSAYFGTNEIQYIMLALQYAGPSGDLFSNGVTSWKNYLFPNFSDLPQISTLSLRLPIIASTVQYTLTADVITRGTSLVPLTPAVATRTQDNGYRITNMDNASRLLVTISLEKKVGVQTTPWGVYRSDSTIPPGAR